MDTNPNTASRPRANYFLVAIVASLIALIIFLAYGVYAFVYLSQSPGGIRLNELGDSLGVVNSIFGVVTTVVIIVTLFMQQEELRLQRQDMKSSIEALQKSATSEEHALIISCLAALIELRKLNLDAMHGQMTGTIGDVLTSRHAAQLAFQNQEAMVTAITEILSQHGVKLSTDAEGRT